MFINASEFEQYIDRLTTENKVEFYALFAHRLTIANRGFWSDKDTSDSLKVSQMKWLNEIQHRIIAKYREERLQLHERQESRIIEMITRYVKQEPSMGPLVAWAINNAYENIVSKDN